MLQFSKIRYNSCGFVWIAQKYIFLALGFSCCAIYTFKESIYCYRALQIVAPHLGYLAGLV